MDIISRLTEAKAAIDDAIAALTPASPIPEPLPPDPTPTVPATPIPPQDQVRAALLAMKDRQWTGMKPIGQHIVRGKQTITGEYVFDPAVKVSWPVDVYVGGEATIRGAVFRGPSGRGEQSAVISMRSGATGRGRLALVEDSDFLGWSSDIIKARGGEVIRGCRFGPLYSPAGSKAHPDHITFVSLDGDVLIEGCLFERKKVPQDGLLNNVFRFALNKGTMLDGSGKCTVTDTLIESDDLVSYLIQIVHSGAYRPRLKLDRVWLPVRAMGGAAKLFHRSTPPAAIEWGEVWDTDTGQRIPAPAGVVSI
jgi:hypothetical protein